MGKLKYWGLYAGLANALCACAGNDNGSDSLTTACISFSVPSLIATLSGTEITSASGLVASRSQSDILYTHTDAGGPASVYAYNSAGEWLATLNLNGIDQVDWEDIAIGPGPQGSNYIYIADIGDNAARQGGTARNNILLYRIAEPTLDSANFAIEVDIAEADIDTFYFTYPNEAHDAEALIVDPITGEIFIFSKENDGTSLVYQAPLPSANSTANLQHIATIATGLQGTSGQVTAGDISPSGDRVILRTYQTILIWNRLTPMVDTFNVSATVIASAPEPQSEGLSFNADGQAWYSIGEQSTAIYMGIENCE